MAAPAADTAVLRAVWAAHFQLLDSSSADEREQELRAIFGTLIRSGSGTAAAGAAAPTGQGGGSAYPAMLSDGTLLRLFPFARRDCDGFLGRQRNAQRLLQVRHILSGPQGFAVLRPGGRGAAAHPEVQQLIAFAAQRALDDTAARHYDEETEKWSASLESARSRLISCLSPQLTATLIADVCRGLLCPSEPPPPDTPEHMAAFILLLRTAFHRLVNEVRPAASYVLAACGPTMFPRVAPGIAEAADACITPRPTAALLAALDMILKYSEVMTTTWQPAIRLVAAAREARDRDGGAGGPRGGGGGGGGGGGLPVPGDDGWEEALAAVEGQRDFAAHSEREAKQLAAAGLAAWRGQQREGGSGGGGGGSGGGSDGNSGDSSSSGGAAAKGQQREAAAQRGAEAVAGRLVRLLTRARAALLLHVLRAVTLQDMRTFRELRHDDNSYTLAPAQAAVLLHLLRALAAAAQTRVTAAAAAAAAAAGGEGRGSASDEEAAAERAIEELVGRFCAARDRFKAHNAAAAARPPGASGAAAAAAAAAAARDRDPGSLPRRLRAQLGAAALACAVFGEPPSVFDPLPVISPRLKVLDAHLPLVRRLQAQRRKALSERLIAALTGALAQQEAADGSPPGLQYLMAHPVLARWWLSVHAARAAQLYCALMREVKARARDPEETERGENLLGTDNIRSEVVRWAAAETLGEDLIPGLPTARQVRAAPAPEAAAGPRGGGAGGALPGDGVAGCAAGCPWCQADGQWDQEWAARQASRQQQQQQQQQQQGEEGAGSVFGDWPVDSRSPFMWRRLMWQLLGRLAPHARDVLAAQAGMCPHSTDGSLWQDVLRCIEAAIVFADPRVAALAGVGQRKPAALQSTTDSPILGYARALNAAFEEAFHPAMVVSAARTIEALSPSLESLYPSAEAMPLAPAFAAAATTRALEWAFGPEDWGPGGSASASASTSKEGGGEVQRGWEMWPVYYHMHMLGLMGHDAEACGAVRVGSPGQAAAARERAVGLWECPGTTAGRRISSSGSSSSSSEEESDVVPLVQAVYSDPDARLAAVRFALRQALLPSDFESLQQQGSYYWLQTHPAHWRAAVAPLAAPWLTCECCGQQPKRGKPLLACRDCGGARFCSDACRDGACAAPYSDRGHAMHALFCSVIERGASDARSRFEAAAAHWRGRRVGESPWAGFSRGSGLRSPPPAHGRGTPATATGDSRRVGQGPAVAAAAAAAAPLPVGVWPEACVGVEEGAIPQRLSAPKVWVVERGD